MAHQIFQLPKQLNISSSFAFAAGAKAYFFATGTSTPQNTYSDAALSTPHAHPVVADAAGVLPPIYLDPSLTYKLTLNTSADALIYTVDPVNDQVLTAALIGQTLWPISATETAASLTAADLEERYYYGDIRRYGAVSGGSAGTNTTAVQRALNANQLVYVPRGTFDLSAQILFNDYNVIRGEGRESILKWNLASTNLIRGTGAASTRRFGFSMQDILLSNTSQSNAGSIMLDLHNLSQGYFHNVEIRAVATCLRLNAPVSGGCYYNKFYAVECLTTGLAIQCGTNSNENEFYGCRAGDFTNGVELDNCGSTRFYGFAAETFTGFAFDIGPTGPVLYTSIIDARIENVTAGSSVGIRLDATDARTTLIVNPMFVNLNANFSGTGLDTTIISGEINSPELRTNVLALGQGGLDNAQHAIIKANAAADVYVRNAADSGFADLRASDIYAARFFRTAGAAFGAASTVTFGNATQSTVGAAGAASALPATPSGYLRFFVGTTEFVLPYYAQA